MVLERQKEYRMVALKAKKQGDVEQAKLYMKTSKVSLRTAVPVICLKDSVFSVEICINGMFCMQDIYWF